MEVGMLLVLGFMLVLTSLLVGAIRAYRPVRFNPVRALGLKPGLYKHNSTGSVIKVSGFTVNTVYITDSTGGRNLDYKILVDNYTFIGDRL